MTNEELVERIKAGEEEHMQELWERVERLIRMLMGRQYWRKRERCEQAGVVEEDLQQEGYFVFLDAIKSYDPNKGHRFTAYLTHHISNHVTRALGLRTKKQTSDPIYTARDIYEEIPGVEGILLVDTIADPAADEEMENAIHTIWLEQLQQDTQEAMQLLTPIQAKVIYLRFHEERTLQEVANVCGWSSRQTAQNTLQQALRKLRQRERDNPLSAYREEIESMGLRGTTLQRFKDTRTSSTEWAAIRLLERG
ncbi:sigma-70 family RNA polymerase sigma factor [Eubacteriales bacterium OttesenSCG-928-M02]|nr:sigma-70 family RNA polymerase sigma factor [Eubacteriales bacterium OttesenSCG-928-M02]